MLVPIFIWCIIIPDFSYRLIGLGLFLIASATDYLDGLLARRWKVTSEFGKFMDPLADKMLVIASLFALLYLEEQVQLWMVLVIIGRDMLITTMRWLAIRRGKSLRTSRLGKIKTTFQMLTIIVILMIIVLRSHPAGAIIRSHFSASRSEGKTNLDIVIHSFSSLDPNLWLVPIPYLLMLATTIFTIISGLRYIFSNYSLFLPEAAKVKPDKNDPSPT